MTVVQGVIQTMDPYDIADLQIEAGRFFYLPFKVLCNRIAKTEGRQL